jgi:hypothetical protein
MSDPDDPQAFAEKIGMALTQRSVVSRAFKFVEGYSIEKTGDRLIEVYEYYAH